MYGICLSLCWVVRHEIKGVLEMNTLLYGKLFMDVVLILSVLCMNSLTDLILHLTANSPLQINFALTTMCL